MPRAHQPPSLHRTTAAATPARPGPPAVRVPAVRLPARRHPRRPPILRLALLGLLITLLGILSGTVLLAQQTQAIPLSEAEPASTAPPQQPALTLAQRRARRFAASRTLPSGAPAAAALSQARAANARLRPSTPTAHVTSTTGLSAAWTTAGPAAIQSLNYGAIAGRVTSLALDPADTTGNTLFVGTTGGGIWKSTNAASTTASAVTFAPLTDDLPVFSPSAGYTATASLSIGALTALPGGILLAGTGDPNDASDSFYGSGLLRSTDSGLTWSLIQGSRDGVAGNHSFLGLGFAGFAYSSTTPSLVVAAVSQSAEGLLVNAGNTSSVMGLYYSVDSGATWKMSTLLDGSQTMQAPSPTTGLLGHAATAVVWNPIRQVFVAAIRYHGYYQSADGITWTRLAAQPGAGLTLAACPTGSGNVSATTCPIFRGALAVQTTSGDTFALTTSLSNTDQGLFQDLCNSTGTACANTAPTWARQLTATPLENGSGVIPQADYNLGLAVMPSPTTTGATLLFAGTADLFRCSLTSTTACTLRNTTNTANGCTTPALVAPAQHALLLGGTTASPLLFLGNDGGLWRSTDTVNQQSTPCSQDDQTHFQNLNTNLGSLAEVVSFAQDPTDPAVLLAGLGAAGTVSNSRSTQTAWQQISSGEGGAVAIDPTNAALWYLTTAAGISVSSCPLGASCTSTDLSAAVGATQVSLDPALLDAPWLLDPAAPANLLAGTCRVWRGPATSPSLWSGSNALSKLLSGPQNSPCASTNAYLASLAAGGPSAAGLVSTGSTVLYAGMAGALAGGGSTAGGHLFSTTTANTSSSTTSWTDLAASLVSNDSANAGLFNPGQFTISSVTADTHDSTGKTVYVTVQGFSGNGISAPHLYGSTDAGAHWTNLSGNLPNAPANALLVDPNDANTVYIALDSGVYATTSITTCGTTSANCWSLFGTALPNTPVTALAAAAAMPTGDGRLGMLRAGTYGRGLWQIPLLTASTLQQPAATLSQAALSFPSQAVGTTSAAQTLLLTNTGTAALNISRIAVNSNNAAVGVQTTVTDFVVSATSASTCTAASIPVGGSCSLAVTFAPSATGARSSTLVVYSNVPGGQSTVALSGSATVAPALVVTPTSLAFGTITLASSTAAQTVTISNTGGVSLALATPTLAGADFSITANTCTTTLAPSTACAVSILFRPASTGARTGTLSVSAVAGTGSAAQTLSQTVTLSGTGTAPPTDSLSATALTFSTTIVGTPSAAQSLILTNAGDTALTLIATSSSSADFAATNTCGNSLAGHSACAITVLFTPHTVGASNATLTVADEFRTQTVTLAGTALAPAGVSLLPAGTLTFPATGLSAVSAAQTLTLTNNGGVPLLISSITPTGDFTFAATGTTCGTTLAPSSACTLSIVFVPTTTGARTGSLTVVSNAPNSPQTVLLSGNGIDFSFAPSAATAGSGNSTAALTLTSGTYGAVPLLVSSATGLSGTVTLTCTGAPVNATCTPAPTTVALGGTTLVTVTIATGGSTGHRAPAATGLQSRLDRPGNLGLGLTLATLVPLGLWTLRRRTALPGLLALTLLIVSLTGCGGTPRDIPGDSASTTTTTTPTVSTPTPAGTYLLTVTATAAGIAHTVVITLTVQ